MAMSAYVGPLKAAPLYFEKDPAPGSGVQWIVFAEAQEAAIPEGPHEGYVEYRDSITPWKYDSDSPAGGAAEPALTKPGVKFLNFTNVCDQYSLRNIGAHKKGWQGKDPVSYTLDSDTAFSTFLGALVQEIALAANAPSAVGKVNGTSFTFSTFGDAAKYLNAWKSATRSLDPTPAVIIEPSTKEGESVIRALRGSAFAGRKISVSVDGVWFGGEGGSGFPTADTKPVPTQSTGTITLSAEAEFPPLLSFTATPVTSPAGIGAGAVVELPGLGHPSHMEWWHFQYEPGYKGKYWMEILELIGWTKEGLLSKAGKMPIFGLYGMGYSPTDIDGKAG